MLTSFSNMPPYSTEGRKIEAGAEWLAEMASGSLAIGLCVLAVALVGLLMLSGRLPVREGLRVALGCSLLLGAPVVASAFVLLGEKRGDYSAAGATFLPVDVRASLPSSNHDPYAGASLRQE